MKKIIIVTALVLAAITASVRMATSQEIGETSPVFSMRGGLICDNLPQVVAAIEANDHRSEGCGILRGAVNGTVTLLGKIEVNNREYMLAEYNFNHTVENPPFADVQYGWWGKVVELGESM